MGSYLADYLFKEIFPETIPVGRGESIAFLCSAGIYAAKKVRENIEGVGPVKRVAVFTSDGEYDQLYPIDILDIEDNLSSIDECLKYFFSDAMDAEKDDAELSADGFLRDIRQLQIEWYKKWKGRVETRKRFREIDKRKSANS